MVVDPGAANPGDETLRLVYDDLVHERDRLRDARRSVTSQLGPLPVASAVVVGLFGAVSGAIRGVLPTILFVFALALFCVMVLESTRALGQSPYRKKRDEILPNDGRGLDGQQEHEWLTRMIEMERTVKRDLETSFEEERSSLIRVQRLFVVQIIALGLIPVVHSLNRLF
jgi:hypothetical protein